jgi:cellulose synthase (UDP-forming)
MKEDDSQLINEAKYALRHGDRARAYRYLHQYVIQSPGDYEGWLMLGGLLIPKDGLKYLQKARILAPENKTVTEAIRWAKEKLSHQRNGKINDSSIESAQDTKMALNFVKNFWLSTASWLLPHDEEQRYQLYLSIFRVLAGANIFLGFFYLIWRYTSSLNLDALWFAIPLVIAETYSFIDVLLFVFMMWKPPRRTSKEPMGDETVDVFITTYNEPIALVELTADAANRIDWPHINVHILDDGVRPEMKAKADELGCNYVSRSEEWDDKPRHAKAGNVNNALMQTNAEFILILDADQIPAPEIIKRTIGYFKDEELAFVQTPQYFYNLPPRDPFGSDAPLFYGPILQGKDGWNAAFFCGSNAVLRREALMQLGLTEFVKEVEQDIFKGVTQLEIDLRSLARVSSFHREILSNLRSKIMAAHNAYKSGQPLNVVSSIIREAVDDANQVLAAQNINNIIEDLNELAVLGDEDANNVLTYLQDDYSAIIDEITSENQSGESIGVSQEAINLLSLTRAEEAIPIQPLATISITEDMATAMRLHALGWKSLFHNEILAYGLAPEDLGSAISQRLRWAQGTIQVFVRNNPLFKRGLSIPQRLQYFTTMFSYFSGFFNLIFLLSPIIYLFTTIQPVSSWSVEFVWRLLPFLLLNKIIFRYVARGLSVWRGEQYSLAMFPVWIQAIISVFTGRKLGFIVTPKQRQSGNFLPLVWPQVLITGLTIGAMLFGIFTYIVGWNSKLDGILVNIFWGSYNIVMLSAIIRAAVYKPPENWSPNPPDFLFSESHT